MNLKFKVVDRFFFIIPSTLVLLLIFPLLRKNCLLNAKFPHKLVKPFLLAFDQLDEQETGMLEEHLAGKQQQQQQHHLFPIAHKTMEFFSPFPLHTPISPCFYSARLHPHHLPIIPSSSPLI